MNDAINQIVDDVVSLRTALERLFRLVGRLTYLQASTHDFPAAPIFDAEGCRALAVRMPRVNGLAFPEYLDRLFQGVFILPRHE